MKQQQDALQRQILKAAMLRPKTYSTYYNTCYNTCIDAMAKNVTNLRTYIKSMTKGI